MWRNEISYADNVKQFVNPRRTFFKKHSFHGVNNYNRVRRGRLEQIYLFRYGVCETKWKFNDQLEISGGWHGNSTIICKTRWNKYFPGCSKYHLAETILGELCCSLLLRKLTRKQREKFQVRQILGACESSQVTPREGILHGEGTPKFYFWNNFY